MFKSVYKKAGLLASGGSPFGIGNFKMISNFDPFTI
jgi:hypothetical protein